MADLADLADCEQIHTDLAIAAARSSSTPELKATGSCLWCEEKVSEGRRFCDADCAWDYQKRGGK